MGVRFDDSIKNKLIVKDVMKGSSAEKAGILKGDLIVSMNHQEVKDMLSFSKQMWKTVKGAIYPIKILRESKVMKLNIKIIHTRVSMVEPKHLYP